MVSEEETGRGEKKQDGIRISPHDPHRSAVAAPSGVAGMGSRPGNSRRGGRMNHSGRCRRPCVLRPDRPNRLTELRIDGSLSVRRGGCSDSTGKDKPHCDPLDLVQVDSVNVAVAGWPSLAIRWLAMV